MIKRIIASQHVKNKLYFFVEWIQKNKKPLWVTTFAYPQIKDLIIKQGFIVEEIKLPIQQKESNLPQIIDQSYPMFEFLSRRLQMKQEKESLQSYKLKLKREGVNKYQLTELERLCVYYEKICQRCKDSKEMKLSKDYQIDTIEGVYTCKTKEVCFLVNLSAKNKKMVIPMKKMKKFFPITLRDYIAELIKAHKEQQERNKNPIYQTPQRIQNSQRQSKSQRQEYDESSEDLESEGGSEEMSDRPQQKSQQNIVNSPSINAQAPMNSLDKQAQEELLWQFQNKEKQVPVEEINIQDLPSSESQKSSKHIEQENDFITF